MTESKLVNWGDLFTLTQEALTKTELRKIFKKGNQNENVGKRKLRSPAGRPLFAFLTGLLRRQSARPEFVLYVGCLAGLKGVSPQLSVKIVLLSNQVLILGCSHSSMHHDGRRDVVRRSRREGMDNTMTRNRKRNLIASLSVPLGSHHDV